MGYAMVLAALRGDTSAVCASFGVLAHGHGVAKQTMHYRWKCEMRKIHATFPRVHDELMRLREQYRHDTLPAMHPNQEAAHRNNE